jgi:molybdopterin-binding protein
MSTDLGLGDAARAIGVSVDTLRRWDRDGRITTHRDRANHRRVPRAEVDRLSPSRERPAGLSARNRLAGTVRSVEVDGVMALVEIDVGPRVVVAAVTRDAIEDLGLRPGDPVEAVVKATDVMVGRRA